MGPRGAKRAGRGLAGVWQGIGRGSDPAKPVPKSVKTTIKSRKNTDPTKKRVAFHSPPPPGAEKVANMAPTWLLIWSQDGHKFDPKIYLFVDAS